MTLTPDISDTLKEHIGELRSKWGWFVALGIVMLIVGVIALVEDLAAAWVLRKDTGSLNVKSTYLHMIADALATIGVIVGAIAIMIWGSRVRWIDPAVTALIAVYIFVHAYHEIRKAIAVLMDSAPKDFDYDAALADLKAIPAVEDVHHLHVWQPEEGKIALEAHIAVSEPDLGKVTDLTERMRRRLRDRHRVDHATIQVELVGRIKHDPTLIWSELCRNLGDGVDQATLCSGVGRISAPSWNLTPAITFGN